MWRDFPRPEIMMTRERGRESGGSYTPGSILTLANTSGGSNDTSGRGRGRPPRSEEVRLEAAANLLGFQASHNPVTGKCHKTNITQCCVPVIPITLRTSLITLHSNCTTDDMIRKRLSYTTPLRHTPWASVHYNYTNQPLPSSLFSPVPIICFCSKDRVITIEH